MSCYDSLHPKVLQALKDLKEMREIGLYASVQQTATTLSRLSHEPVLPRFTLLSYIRSL